MDIRSEILNLVNNDEVCFPWLTPSLGLEWKGSNEQRDPIRFRSTSNLSRIISIPNGRIWSIRSFSRMSQFTFGY